MRKTTSRFLLAGFFATGLSACGAEGTTDRDLDLGEDDAPLSSYDEVLGDAPANHTLPDENKADAVYPPVFTDLIALQSPVQSQGSRGVCSIFSTVGLMEHLYIKAGQPGMDFSEQYLQWSTKVKLGAFTNTSGSSADVNLRAISTYGVPLETAWPYESFPWTEANDPACKGEESSQPVQCFTNGSPPESATTATMYKLPRGRWLNTNSIKAHMTTKKTAVLVGLDFFYQSWNHRKSTLPVNADSFAKGYVLAPNDDDVTESHKQRAGHSILLVGWDDNLELPIVDKDGKPVLGEDGQAVKEKGFYIFKNSWGTGRFGTQNPHGAGYGFISYRYVEDYGSANISDLPQVTPPPPPPPAGGDTFSATPNAAIPDNNATGITSDISVPAEGTVNELTVTVDITHPYVGDLVVKLTHGDKTVTLHNKQGGADDNLKKTFTVADFRGAAKTGTWTLSVADTARADEGALNSWSLVVR